MNIEQILQGNNGANYYWTDLHIHTPICNRFKLPSGLKLNNEKDKEIMAEKYIEDALKKDLTILGITEHNDVSWIDNIRNAAKGTLIKIFPGFEITTRSGSDGIHVLCIFNPGIDSETLGGLLSNFGLLPGKRFFSDGSPKAVNKPLDDIIDSVKENDGICIAAHSISDNGLLAKSSGQIRIDLFTNSDLLAIEIPKGRNELPGFPKRAISNQLDHYKRKFPIACLNSSDAKAIKDIGRRKTLIKLSKFNVEGLRLAFLDWGSKIRLQDEIKEHKSSKIIIATWEGGFLDGIQIHFNDNMNAIIGGRGTGKTTVIETLRYALNSKPKTVRNEKDHEQILKEVFKSGSKVSLLVESHHPTPKRYIIERTFPYDPVVKELDGGVRQDLEPSDIFNAEIYGHKEIYEISKDPTFQFTLLDRFIEEKLVELKESEDNLVKSLSESKVDIIRLKSNIEKIEDSISTLPRLEEQLKRYKTLKIQDKLETKRKFDNEKHLLELGIEKIKYFERIFQDFKDNFKVKLYSLEEKKIENLVNKHLLKKAKELLEEFAKAVNTDLKSLDIKLEKTRRTYSEIYSAWEEIYKKNEEIYKETLRKLQNEYPDIDVAEFVKIEEKIRKLQLMKEEKDKYDKKIIILHEEREKLLTKLYENRRLQYKTRHEVVGDLNKKLEGTLKIELIFEGGKEGIKGELKNLRSGFRIEHIERILEHNQFSIQKFVRALREGAENFSDTFSVPISSALNLIQSINEEKIYDFEVFEIPTKAIIQLNIGTKTDPLYREIDHLSDGQRCTALLTLILLESPNPLIIDQPEEDLDNTFIVDDIVQKLRQQKDKREFIISTHNANIPILGDSELIVILDADERKGYIKNSGYIDEEDVKTIVESTLEGGKQAFEMRKEKYGI